MKPIRRTGNHLAPRQQTNWDWRAAANFIFGGAGSGLLFCAALASLHGIDVRLLVFGGLALVGLGLTCVWFEIGRPWRAMNVFLHIQTSWMTREAMVGSVLFASGGAALLSLHPLFLWTTAALAVGFVYSQARILAANKGIPAWRHRGCLPLVVATGLTEGAGLVAISSLVYPQLVHVGVLLAMLAGMRAVLWRSYKSQLSRDGAPAGTIKVYGALDGRFFWGGGVLPAALGLLAVATGLPILLAVGGIAAVAGGVWFKYSLVCRAAFNQGFALQHLPTRGKSAPLPGAKPGWNVGRAEAN